MVSIRQYGHEFKNKKMIPSPVMFCVKLPLYIHEDYELVQNLYGYVFFTADMNEKYYETYSENDELTHHFYFHIGDKIVPVCLLKTSNKFCYLSGDSPTYATVISFDFPAQDNYHIHFEPDSESEEYGWKMTGIFESDTKICEELPEQLDENSETVPVESYNLSITQLKTSEYLIGIHDHNLYKLSTDGEFEEVDQKLKNFRLRELKNISKSKK